MSQQLVQVGGRVDGASSRLPERTSTDRLMLRMDALFTASPAAVDRFGFPKGLTSEGTPEALATTNNADETHAMD